MLPLTKTTHDADGSGVALVGDPRMTGPLDGADPIDSPDDDTIPGSDEDAAGDDGDDGDETVDESDDDETADGGDDTTQPEPESGVTTADLSQT